MATLMATVDSVDYIPLPPSANKWQNNVKPRDPANFQNTQPVVPASEAEAADPASWSRRRPDPCAHPWSTEQIARVCAFQEVKAAVQEMKPAAEIANSYLLESFYPGLKNRVARCPRPDCVFSIEIATHGSHELATALHARLAPLFPNGMITVAADYSTITVRGLSAKFLASIDPEASAQQQKGDAEASPLDKAKIIASPDLFVGLGIGFFSATVTAIVFAAHVGKL